MAKPPTPPQQSGSRPLPPPPPSRPAPPPARPQPQQSPFGGLGSRFGARAAWEIMPMSDLLVRFDINLLGAPLYELLGIPVPQFPVEGEAANVDVPFAENAFLALENDKALVDTLKEKLEAAWETYQVKGALLVYGWREEVKQSIVGRLNSVKAVPVCLRSLDPLLTLNVLARSRTALLVAKAPLALERAFLGRPLASDDPRLLKLVRAHAHFEEALVEPEPEAKDESEEES